MLGCIPFFSQAQFTPDEGSDLTIIVTDGTDEGHDSKIPTKPKSTSSGSYDAYTMLFLDPIRPLGMADAIQAAAFLERPKYGKAGFLLIFCVNDSIGGKQGILDVRGTEYKGVYRLIRQKFTIEEPIPEGMAAYKLQGTVFILGVS